MQGSCRNETASVGTRELSWCFERHSCHEGPPDLFRGPFGNLIDADHDPECIADREAGGDTITFITPAGIGYVLTLKGRRSHRRRPLLEPVLTRAVAAAILNHCGG